MVKIEDLINVEFSRALMGYDMKEVDGFLDAVIEQMEAFESERKEMLTALEYLLRELEQLEQGPEGAQKRVTDRRASAHRQARQTAENLRSSMDRADAGSAKRAQVREEPPAAQPAAAPPQPEEAEDEIPTYVFAGVMEEDGDAWPDQAEPRAPVAEEFETGEAAPAAAPETAEEPARAEEPPAEPERPDTQA